tara:strand:+ start:747 stop:875 length:129 start_codon:yes stop_codon:yes gene_type:complete
MYAWDSFVNLARIYWGIVPTQMEGRGAPRQNTKIGMEFIEFC